MEGVTRGPIPGAIKRPNGPSGISSRVLIVAATPVRWAVNLAGASPYGVLDIAGNVMERVNDWYAENYYSATPANNPQQPTSGLYKVLRLPHRNELLYSEWGWTVAFGLRNRRFSQINAA